MQLFFFVLLGLSRVPAAMPRKRKNPGGFLLGVAGLDPDSNRFGHSARAQRREGLHSIGATPRSIAKAVATCRPMGFACQAGRRESHGCRWPSGSFTSISKPRRDDCRLCRFFVIGLIINGSAFMPGACRIIDDATMDEASGCLNSFQVYSRWGRHGSDRAQGPDWAQRDGR